MARVATSVRAEGRSRRMCGRLGPRRRIGKGRGGKEAGLRRSPVWAACRGGPSRNGASRGVRGASLRCLRQFSGGAGQAGSCALSKAGCRRRALAKGTKLGDAPARTGCTIVIVLCGKCGGSWRNVMVQLPSGSSRPRILSICPASLALSATFSLVALEVELGAILAGVIFACMWGYSTRVCTTLSSLRIHRRRSAPSTLVLRRLGACEAEPCCGGNADCWMKHVGGIIGRCVRKAGPAPIRRQTTFIAQACHADDEGRSRRLSVGRSWFSPWTHT